VFCFPKKTCFINIENYVFNTKIIIFISITLTWGCLCGRGMHYFFTHNGCAVYALHFNAFMDLKPFMRQARYAAGALCGVTTHRTAMPEVPGLIPDPNKAFYVVLLLLLCLVQTIICHDNLQFILQCYFI